MRDTSFQITVRRAGWLALACTMAIVGPTARTTRAAEPQAANGPVDPAEAQLRAQARQLSAHWESQLTRLLFSHLELVRGICGDLPKETRRAISKAGDDVVKQMSFELAEQQLGARRLRGPGVPQPQPAARPRPWSPAAIDAAAAGITAAIEKAVAESVGPEEAAAFAAELAARNDRRKQAAIDACVAMLDAHVVLSAAQREAIARSLADRWNEDMLMKLRVVNRHNSRLVLDKAVNDCVLPHLDEPQRRVYSGPGNQRVEVHVAGQSPMADMLGRMQPPLPRDPWWFE